MKAIAFIAFTQAGCALAVDISQRLATLPEYAHASFSVAGPQRYAKEMDVDAYQDLSTWTAEHFAADDALVFVGASGIAVRAIAPHVQDKFTDPAVVSVDEAGRFAVPLLSGHVGGANDLARAIADVLGAQAAVSTATDVNGLFAVDEWAARHGLAIVERDVAKEISAALLEGRAVGYETDFDIEDQPQGVAKGKELPTSASSCRSTRPCSPSRARCTWCRAPPRLAWDAAREPTPPCSGAPCSTRSPKRACHRMP